MADRLAQEFQDGWIVNLGVGIPTLCSNTDIGDRDILYHAENGVIGYGPVLPEGQEDLHLVNAGGQNVSLRPGAAIVHHADSFALIRSGRIDATVMGAYEVAASGDFANWKIAANAKGGGIGVVAAFLTGIALLYRFAEFSRIAEGYFAGVILAATAIAAVAWMDDMWNWPFTVKLAAQLGAALVAVGSGLVVSALNLPLLGPVSLGWLGAPLTLLWILFATNAMNFIDGLNGLAAGVRVYLGKDVGPGGEPAAFQDVGVFGGAVLADGVYVG